MKGSILFNKDINIEVDVDPAAEEGARLSSAKNLVDGQELGVGGSDLPEVTVADEGKVLAVNASGEWAVEEIYIPIEYNEGTGETNLSPFEAINLIKQGKMFSLLFGSDYDDENPTDYYANLVIFNQCGFDSVWVLYSLNNVTLLTTSDTNINSHFYVEL